MDEAAGAAVEPASEALLIVCWAVRPRAAGPPKKHGHSTQYQPGVSLASFAAVLIDEALGSLDFGSPVLLVEKLASA